MSMKKITKAKDLVEEDSYLAHYIDNKRTHASHVYATVSGVTAKEMLETSSTPDRIFFTEAATW